ncbi:cyclic GMP-AMP synthase-like [Heliangelus exortis]|uniref:cyclic GMP-AMP synthase-like n=1 Tax=Heliangelus exortis TaxID=472823 RepID=UPI003A90CE87
MTAPGSQHHAAAAPPPTHPPRELRKDRGKPGASGRGKLPRGRDHQAPPGLAAEAGSRSRRRGRGCRSPAEKPGAAVAAEGGRASARRQAEAGEGVPLTRTPAQEDGPGRASAPREKRRQRERAARARPSSACAEAASCLRPPPAGPAQLGALVPAAAICRRLRPSARADPGGAAALRQGTEPRLPQGKRRRTPGGWNPRGAGPKGGEGRCH